MLMKLNERLGKSEDGFTLIELMVVVLIIAILIAIAIPTFLGARKKAQDRAAQSNVRNALTAEKTYYTDAQAYTASSTALLAIEPSLVYVATTATMTTTGNKVYVDVSGSTVTVGAKSASGTCFWLSDDATSGTKYGNNNCSAVLASGSMTSSPW